MNRLGDISTAFCLSLGGLSLLLAGQGSVTGVLIVTFGAAIYLTLCCLAARKTRETMALGRIRYFVGGYAVVSSAVSVFLSSRLVVDAGVIDSGFYPLMVLLTLLLAFCFSVSKQNAVSSVAFVTSFAAAVLLCVMLFLCVVKTSFSPISFSPPDPKLLFLISAFSVFDVSLALPRLCGKSRMLFFGGMAAQLYGAVTTLVAASVLSGKVFEGANTPLLLLWRSTFIASFFNSFEIVGVCMFCLMCAVKAGYTLSLAVSVFGKKAALPAVLASATAVVILSVWGGVIYAAALLSVISGILLPVALLAKQKPRP